MKLLLILESEEGSELDDTNDMGITPETYRTIAMLMAAIRFSLVDVQKLAETTPH